MQNKVVFFYDFILNYLFFSLKKSSFGLTNDENIESPLDKLLNIPNLYP